MSSQPVTGHRESRPRRRRRLVIALVAIVVVVGLLLVANSVARAYTEKRVATQLQSNGFGRKPDVTIDGFPFLTQFVARNFSEVQVSSHDISEGPVTIKTMKATLNDVRVNSSYDGGTVSRLTGTALITFPDLAKAFAAQLGSLGVAAVSAANIKFSAAGPNKVKATIDLLIASGTVTWRVTRAGTDEIKAKLIASDGIPASVLSRVSGITVPLPALPLDVRIKSLRVSAIGVVGKLAGSDISFGS
jgi:hypothetical protein